MSVLVIAEAGSTHDGSFNQAVRLMHAAHRAGADAIKYQFWSDPDRLAERRQAPDFYREIYRRYQMPRDWLLALHAESLGPLRKIELMCTTYLPEDVATVAPFVKRFKVASFEAQDKAFIEAHPRTTEVIVSLGMADEVPHHLSSRHGVRLLQCVSAYPAPPEAANLSLLGSKCSYHGEWEAPEFEGLSDHSRHLWMGALAVAAGAEIIEAHIRLEDTDPQNPDYAAAFTPAEFAEYVRHIRFAERCLGDGVKRMHESEREMSAYRVRS